MLGNFYKTTKETISSNLLPVLIISLFMTAATVSTTTFFMDNRSYQKELYDEEQTLYVL